MDKHLQVARALARRKERYHSDPVYRERVLVYNNNRYQTNLDFKLRRRASNRLYLHGITDLQFQTLLFVQCGKCAICTEVFDFESKETSPHVDHNHETNQIRGLLCNKCNRAIGLLKDDPEVLLAASDYLKE